MPVHDSTIRFDWSPDNFIIILETDYDDFWLRLIIGLLAHTNVCIGLEGLQKITVS